MLRAESFLTPPRVYPIREISDLAEIPTTTISGLCDGCSESSLEAHSQDGTSIPISLVSPKDPLGVVVHVYGAYGISSYATFSPSTVSLVNHGIAVAIAHVRGGGELGPSWHTQTLGGNKQRSIDDIRAATKHLQNVLRLSPQQTILSGRSAGGLLVSYAALTTPGLCGSLILDAPLLDLAYILEDSSLPLHEREVHEWGRSILNPLAGYSQVPPILISLNILLHVPLRDELIPPETSLRWAHRALCTLDPESLLLVSVSAHGQHAGPLAQNEQEEWDSLQEVFARIVTTRNTPQPTHTPMNEA